MRLSIRPNSLEVSGSRSWAVNRSIDQWVTGRATDAEVIEMDSNLRAVIEPERESALHRLSAIITLGALVLRAAWALIRWGHEAP